MRAALGRDLTVTPIEICGPTKRHFPDRYPRQTPDEATLIKVYDSATDGRARLSAHTAFEDPTSAPASPPRRSIEIRALVFW